MVASTSFASTLTLTLMSSIVGSARSFQPGIGVSARTNRLSDMPHPECARDVATGPSRLPSRGRRKRIVPSALFAAPSNAPVPDDINKGGRSSLRLRRILMLPLRVLLFRPLVWIAKLIVKYLDEKEDRSNDAAGNRISTVETSKKGDDAKAQATVEISPVATNFEDLRPVAPTGSASVALSGSAAWDMVSLGESVADEVAEVIGDAKSVIVGDAIRAVTSNDPDADVETAPMDTGESSESASDNVPAGDRWAVAAPGVDLSGTWQVIVTEQFKKDYDEYLSKLGQPILVRSVALNIISMTTEVTKQTDDGKALLIRGKNIRGVWDRTLVSSGTEPNSDSFAPLRVPIMTADSERVEAESWWEDGGTVHVSWLRGVEKYGGGEFESRRYLEGDGKIYVCESTFHKKGREDDDEKVSITWKFSRQEHDEGAANS